MQKEDVTEEVSIRGTVSRGAFGLRAFNLKDIKWGGRRGLNPRPPESQSGALPTELRPPLSITD